MKKDELLSTRQAAEFLGCKVHRIYNLVQYGKLKIASLKGKVNFFKKDDLVVHKKRPSKQDLKHLALKQSSLRHPQNIKQGLNFDLKREPEKFNFIHKKLAAIEAELATSKQSAKELVLNSLNACHKNEDHYFTERCLIHIEPMRRDLLTLREMVESLCKQRNPVINISLILNLILLVAVAYLILR